MTKMQKIRIHTIMEMRTATTSNKEFPGRTYESASCFFAAGFFFFASAFFFLGYDLIPIQIEVRYLVSHGFLDSSSVIVIDVLTEYSALLQSL